MKKSVMFILIIVFVSMAILCSARDYHVITVEDLKPQWPIKTNRTFYLTAIDYYKTSGKHNGIDIGNNGGSTAEERGEYIYPVAEGVVTSAGYEESMGYYVKITHTVNGKKYYSRYMHFLEGSIPSNIYEGAYVDRDTIIGRMGNTGESSGTHLHFDITNTNSGTYSELSLIRGYTLDYYINNPEAMKDVRLSASWTNSSGANNSAYWNWITENCTIDNGEYVFPYIQDTEVPTISDLGLKDVTGESFTVECNLNDNVGVTRVWINVWGPNASFKGYALSTSNGTFSHTIKTSNYGGEGYYSVHIYAFDAAGNESEEAKLSGIYAYTDTENPTISNLKTTNVSGDSFTIECDLNDNVGVTRVWLVIFKDGKQLDGFGKEASSGYYSYTVNTADYGGAGSYEVHLYAYDDKNNQVGTSTGNIGAWVNLGDKFYAHIINTESGFYVVQDESNNAVIQTYADSSSHIWEFAKQEDGGYKIISTKNGLCLDVLGAGTEAGTNVRLWEDNGMLAQRWYISGTANDYTIKSGCSECVLDVAGADYQDGTNVHMWTNTNHPAQKFSIIKTELNVLPPEGVKVEVYGNDVTVTWNASEKATSYEVCLIQSPWGEEDIKYRKTVSETSCTFESIEGGEYNVFVRAKRDDLYAQSEWVQILVEEKTLDYTVNSLSVDKSDDRIYAEAEIKKNSDRDAVDTIMIAVYKDDVLIDRIYMRSKFAKGQSVVFGGYLDNADNVTIKAFVWDGVSMLNPLSNVVTK